MSQFISGESATLHAMMERLATARAETTRFGGDMSVFLDNLTAVRDQAAELVARHSPPAEDSAAPVTAPGPPADTAAPPPAKARSKAGAEPLDL